MGGVTFEFVESLMKTSSQPVSKLRQFMHSKPSYPIFTLALCNFKRIKAIAIFKNEVWCLVVFVDKLRKDNTGVKNFTSS